VPSVDKGRSRKGDGRETTGFRGTGEVINKTKKLPKLKTIIF
jgi:hypothetical protein